MAASARPTVIFAIDDAAANDVMVFRMVRRSGLLYRIVSSLAAVCFDCPLEVVVGDQHAETRIRHNGPQPRLLADTDARTNTPGAAAPRKWASSHFESRSLRTLAVGHELITFGRRRVCFASHYEQADE